MWCLFILLIIALPIAAHEGTATEEPPTTMREVTVRFAARAGDSDIVCGILYDALGAQASTVMINDFRFYVSNMRVLTDQGEEVALELIQDGLWQHDNVALLDFEDGTTTCRETGNAPMNNRVVGMAPDHEITGIVFDVGVPFALNHLDTTTAPSPLNVTAMWWGWQYGYKFVRIDLMNDANSPWFIHLGSNGCEAEAFTIPPTDPCANPNLFTVRFDDFDPERNFAVLDLALLVQTVNLDEFVPEPPGCMSQITDPDCVGIFEGFGIDLETGVPLEGIVPALFRVQ
jgi:uncharacterized repeat protein (TIGR04052 family)